MPTTLCSSARRGRTSIRCTSWGRFPFSLKFFWTNWQTIRILKPRFTTSGTAFRWAWKKVRRKWLNCWLPQGAEKNLTRQYISARTRFTSAGRISACARMRTTLTKKGWKTPLTMRTRRAGAFTWRQTFLPETPTFRRTENIFLISKKSASTPLSWPTPASSGEPWNGSRIWKFTFRRRPTPPTATPWRFGQNKGLSASFWLVNCRLTKLRKSKIWSVAAWNLKPSCTEQCA